MKRLNDFYNLLYEKMESKTIYGIDPPEYFQQEKYYTMGPGIDFPLVMSYKDLENPTFMPYFYFLNGHGDVTYFADQNFTEDQIETYEYNPWGVLLTSANKNSILFRKYYFDEYINAYYLYNSVYYFSSIGILNNLFKLVKQNNYSTRNINKNFQILYLNDNLFSKAWQRPGATINCKIDVRCSDGGIITASCNAKPYCACYCSTCGDECICTELDCPFDYRSITTIKCC